MKAPMCDRFYELSGITISSACESHLATLVAEQVSLAVAEHKKDADRFRKLISNSGLGICKKGMIELSVYLPEVDHISHVAAALDRIEETPMLSTEQTKGA